MPATSPTRSRLRSLRAALIGIAFAAAVSAGAQQPMPHAHIFPDVAAAHDDIAAALKSARHEHKRVILDFGGDWCGDCQVLNLYFHQPENLDLLNKHYILVDVNIGHIDQNLDIGTKYGVNLKKGVPALSVLKPDGQVVHAQTGGEFADMRHMESSSVHDFLEQWK
jgi:thiol:disulfide interchange protein